MATSGTTSGLQTARQIVTDSLIELQVIPANETPAAADAELGMRRLTWMLKEWQDDGLNLWRMQEGTASFAAGVAQVTPTPRMADIDEVRLVQAGGYERTLSRMEWGQFVSYPNKTTQGTPSVYVPITGLDTLALRLWPVPSTDVAVNFSGSRVIEDVSDLNQNVDVPQQHTHTVMMNLAARLAPSFGLSGDPNAIVTIREAARLYQIMRAADRPASYFLERA
jgi:hypothetical protein